MKKASLVVAVSFSLMSASALAGGNCFYDSDGKHAEVDPNLSLQEVDPALLALLKKQQDQIGQTTPVVTFN